MRETGVVLGIGDPGLQEEVLDLLDRLPAVRVVDAATDPDEVARGVQRHRPGAAVVSPDVLATTRLDGSRVLVVAATESTETLRVALRSGAAGFYLWPEERDGLARDVSAIAPDGQAGQDRATRVIGVFAARGGAGVTFIATNLAAALARLEEEAVLIDLDPMYGDVPAALGEDPTTAQDGAAPSAALRTTATGVSVLEAPVGSGETIGRDVAVETIQALRGRYDSVILHLPRSLDPATQAALVSCDSILVVLTLDVLAIRATARALDRLDAIGVRDRCRLVVNRAGRGEIVPEDAERVLGVEIAGLVRDDRAVPRAQNRGELVVGRSSSSGRSLVALARRLIGGEAT